MIEPTTSGEPSKIDIIPTIIESDLPCCDCGYNLRGLARDGRCPECGGDIAVSIQAFEQSPWNAKSLRRIRLGILIMLGGYLPWTIGLGNLAIAERQQAPSLVILSAIAAGAPSPWIGVALFIEPIRSNPFAHWAADAAAVIGCFTWLLGIFFITPLSRHHSSRNRLRWSLRASLIAAFLLPLLALPLHLIDIRLPPIGELPLLFFWPLLFAWLGWLAQQFHLPTLRKRLIVLSVAAILAHASIGAGYLPWFNPFGNRWSLALIIGGFSLAGAVGVVTAIILYVLLRALRARAAA